MKKIIIAVHGGAGTIKKSELTEEKEQNYLNGLSNAVEAGYKILSNNGSALDAVEAAVRILEDDINFNAGRGSVFTAKGEHEMDASIMDGKTLKAGAVAGVHGIKNPVTLARSVMDKTEFVLLSGKGAMEFAIETEAELKPEYYFFSAFRHKQLEEAKKAGGTYLDHTNSNKKMGTVGAVALDIDGNIAAATSTGGMTNKQWGRVGDSPIIGSGTYANNNTCAVSCTGHGEFFIRSVVAYDISCLMEYKGLTLKEACKIVVKNKLKEIGGEGGLIAVDKNGHLELIFNSSGMYRGYKINDQEIKLGIYEKLINH